MVSVPGDGGGGQNGGEEGGDGATHGKYDTDRERELRSIPHAGSVE
jgi:hypothetical protein